MSECDRIAADLMIRADGAPEGGALAVEEHLRGCASCASRDRDARARVAAFRALPRRPAPAELDRRVRLEIEDVVSGSEAGRERLVSRWLGRLGRHPVPEALGASVRSRLDGRTAPARGRLFRILGPAAAAAASLAVAWSMFGRGEAKAGPDLRIVDVTPSRLKSPTGRSLASGVSLTGLRADADDARTGEPR